MIAGRLPTAAPSNWALRRTKSRSRIFSSPRWEVIEELRSSALRVPEDS
jgi:hypothetical protein